MKEVRLQREIKNQLLRLKLSFFFFSRKKKKHISFSSINIKKKKHKNHFAMYDGSASTIKTKI